MTITSVKDFVDKIKSQTDKITAVINDEQSTENSKRIFIIDNKDTMTKMEEAINKVLKEVESTKDGNDSNEEIILLKGLKEEFYKTKEFIYKTLLSISNEIEESDEILKHAGNEDDTMWNSLGTYHIIINGNLKTYENTDKESINNILNDEMLVSNYNVSEVIVINGGTVMPLKTKVII